MFQVPTPEISTVLNQDQLLFLKKTKKHQNEKIYIIFRPGNK